MAQTHVAIVPSPGMGHLIPLVEFAKRLVVIRPDFDVVFIVPTIGEPTEAMKSVLSPMHHLFLPPVTFHDDLSNGDKLFLSMSLSAPPLRHSLTSLSQTTPFSAIVFDFFSAEALPSVLDLNIPAYIFSATGATNVSLCFHISKLDRVVSCEYRDLPGPVQAPGCIPVHGRDLMDPVQDRKSKLYQSFLRMVKNLGLADGILVNTFTEMEQGAIKALQEQEGPPVYAVGPLINDGSSGDRDDECLRWLDEQERGSVVFVSFGSGGTLSHAQQREVALGLEMSGKRFLWVVRNPNDASTKAAYFGEGEGSPNPLESLPQGFVERNKGKGLVVPFWAPQPQVLRHASVGGFLSHSGWNSVLECIVNAMPLIAWPLYADQNCNALLICEHLKVAVRPEFDGNGMVSRQEIVKLVNALMEGQQGKLIRQRMQLLKDAANKALTEDGDSGKALTQLTNKWSNI